MKITLPDTCLVVLIGVTGSGKSTFARRHFAPTRVLSSDQFRAMLADDENDQSVTAEAFETLHHVAGKRLAAGRLTVVDATNVQQHARAALVALARAHDVLPVAIVLDTPESVCWERTEARADRDFGRNVVRRQHQALRRSMGGLRREGFSGGVFVVADPTDVEVDYKRLHNDRRDLTGPFDIVGDVHGCHAELVELLTRLGYTVRPDGAAHPDGRTAVFVGDLVDRGPQRAVTGPGGHLADPVTGVRVVAVGRGRDRQIQVRTPVARRQPERREEQEGEQVPADADPAGRARHCVHPDPFLGGGSALPARSAGSVDMDRPPRTPER